MGKGDHRRPLDVDPQEFADNWERIFAKRKEESDRQIEEALLQHAEDVFSQSGVALKLRPCLQRISM